MVRGRFITFEGGEGTGKSSQIARLKQKLEQDAIRCLLTREPGGTAEAEIIRREILMTSSSRWSALSEALLMNAARDSHLRQTIRPALAQGINVLCDRFMDSSRAYQGYAGGVSLELIDMLEKFVVEDTRPDLTLIFDLDPVIGLARVSKRNALHTDRFERMELAFHQKLREGFLMIAAKEPQRCTVIDASGDENSVFAAVRGAVAEYFDLPT